MGNPSEATELKEIILNDMVGELSENTMSTLTYYR